VRLNTGNRAFLGIVLVAGGIFALFAATGCWVAGILVYRLATAGPTSLTDSKSFPALVLLVLLGATDGLAFRSLRSQTANTRRLLRWVREYTTPTPPALQAAAEAANLGQRVVAVSSDDAFSFTFGVTRPRVAVSRGLLDSVGSDELAAVLCHERYHVANYDPLKVVLARVLPTALFYVPVLGELRGRYVAGRELAADRRAIQTTGPAGLAGALYKVIAGPPGLSLAATAAIGGDEAIDARVEQLESGTEPNLGRLSRRAVATSLAGGGVLAWSSAASIVGFAPLMAKLCAAG